MVLDQLSRAAGRGMASVFGVMKLFRPDRPIHPAGVGLKGTLVRETPSVPSGITWIDTAGTDAVSGRFSRSIGLPPKLPDILGLALRVGSGGTVGDLLLSSTGVKVPGRFFLVPRVHAAPAAFTSIMPYKGSSGPVLLGARTVRSPGPLPSPPADFRRELDGSEWELELFYARPAGRWTRFGRLVLTADDAGPDAPDTALRFDAVRNPLPGAGTYGWARLLREPSYARARLPRPGRGPGLRSGPAS